MDSEEALLHRARSGDSKAFGELVHRTMRRAYYVALGLVGSPEDAMDLSQEAFARAFRARRRLDPARPFFAWIYQILRNLCFNFIRDRSTRQHHLRNAEDWLVSGAESRAVPGPERALEQAEVSRTVTKSIESLPEREREVLVLKEFEGLKYKEIAELVGIPIGTVMSRLYTARRRLAADLEDER